IGQRHGNSQYRIGYRAPLPWPGSLQHLIERVKQLGRASSDARPEAATCLAAESTSVSSEGERLVDRDTWPSAERATYLVEPCPGRRDHRLWRTVFGVFVGALRSAYRLNGRSAAARSGGTSRSPDVPGSRPM